MNPWNVLNYLIGKEIIKEFRVFKGKVNYHLHVIMCNDHLLAYMFNYDEDLFEFFEENFGIISENQLI